MSSTGPNWNEMALIMNAKAKKATMSLMKIGFNKHAWAPAAKIDIYKVFIRPLLEYGMQITLYDNKNLQLFEKSQQLALRIAFGVPWNTSKTALKRLSCLESVKTRNHLLNAKFLWKLKYQVNQFLPAFRTFEFNLENHKSLTYGWRKSNLFYHRTIHLSPLDLKKEVDLIRFENIDQDDMGHTNVSNAIPVRKDIKRSAILYWSGMDDMSIKLELIQWRLGRIAFHQRCGRCNEFLSRKHAVICSGAEDYLISKFPDVDPPTSQTIIDAILNKFFSKDNSSAYFAIYEAIQAIRKTCLLQNIPHVL
jgi:hypothetical protein